MRLDPGCCRILPQIGGQLAEAGRIDEAERFITAAPTMVNVSAELALAQALDRDGQIARAIKYLSRICGKVASYGAELLIGYGYERLGDKILARQHYLRAVALLLNADIAATLVFPDIAPAVTSAERFLRSTGNKKQAEVLRQDDRLAKFFIESR